MELGPIFRALINHRTRFWLIVTEIALTLAIVTNCITMIMGQRERIMRPTGLAEEELLVVRSEPFATDFEDDAYLDASTAEDLRALRALPGVKSAMGIAQIPLSGGGSASGRRATGSEEDGLTTPYFVVGPSAIDTLGVQLAAGRSFIESDFPTREQLEAERDSDEVTTRNVILTKDLADTLYPDGDALGKTIENKSGTVLETVVGIMDRMHCSWPTSTVAERAMLYPGLPQRNRDNRYMVRVEPERIDELYTVVEETLNETNAGRIVTVSSLKEIKRDTYSDLIAVNQLLGGLSVLLILVTALGIIGLTSFSVTERTREIGTRRALGATRVAILRYFLIENWVMTGIGLAVGVVLAFALNFGLANWADVPRMAIGQLLGGMLALWLAGLVAALAPAIRGTLVPPVIATRNV